LKQAFISAALVASIAGAPLPVNAQEDVATEIVTFEAIDSDATQVARRMYGRYYPVVQARRVWLEEPTDGYDQMVVRLGENRRCDPECMVVVLYYSEPDSMWLEVWRGKGDEIGIGEIGMSGIRSLHADDGRIWKWQGANYAPTTLGEKPEERTASETEKRATFAALKEEFLEIPTDIEPPDYSAYDAPLKDGDETIVYVNSIYFCGNTACPLVILDGEKRPLSLLYAYDWDFAIRPERDEEGYPPWSSALQKGLGSSASRLASRSKLLARNRSRRPERRSPNEKAPSFIRHTDSSPGGWICRKL
jgi:hypothetical protein